MDMIDRDERVQRILADHSDMESARSPFETTWREIDRYVDPQGGGGFDKNASPDFGAGDDLFDSTAAESLGRGTSVIVAATAPRSQRWHGVGFDSKELMKLASVRLWCEVAQDALFEHRYDPAAGFEVAYSEDARQELKYGTSALWVDERRGRYGMGLAYKTIHMGQMFIRSNFYGMVDQPHRAFQYTLRQAIQHFGLEKLHPKMQELANDAAKLNQKFDFLHVVCPNEEYEPGRLGAKGKPVASIYLDATNKFLISESGYYTLPSIVSRHVTAPGDDYGRSPAMVLLPTIRGVNAMQRITLDAGNRALDPPLLFDDDADLTSIQAFPGGLIPGGMSDGKQMLMPLQTGGQVAIGMEMVEAERGVIKRVFFEEFFRLLSNPQSDRMTATQVIEQLQKEGVLLAPYAGRRETEKLCPMIERELDILMRMGRIPPFPPEVSEAGARPRARMTNPMSRMARAEEVSGFSRLIEMGVGIASATGNADHFDTINVEAGLRDSADVLGVRPSHIRSPDEVAEIRAGRQAEKAGMEAASVMPDAAKAALDLSKAGQIQQQLQDGGGF